MIPALIILALVLLNGLFVAAEFAIISAPRPALEHAASLGSRTARRVLDVIRDPKKQDRYIATAQLGITLASLGLGMYGEHVLAHALEGPLARLGLGASSVHAAASVASVGLLTYLHIVLGEMVPKTLALQHPIPTALWVSRPMLWVKQSLLPVVIALNAIGEAFLRVLGVRREAASQAPTTDDLRFIIAESMAEGKIEADAGEVLTEIFDFGERTAAEVMTPRVRIVGFPRGATAKTIRRVLRGRRHTRYPVYDGSLDRVIGFVLIRDLLEVLLEGKPLPDSLIHEVPFVPETSRLDRVLSHMRKQKKQMAVVMDEFGGTAGIVTVEDLFEEVVGEIADGPASRLPVDWVDGKLRAQGPARLDELGEELDRPLLEHPEVDTVSGLVLSILDRPPEVGDVVSWEGLEFVVLSVEGHGVKECEVRRIAPSSAPPPETT